MKNIIKTNGILIILIAGIFTNCKKFIEIPLPQNQILTQNLFSDDSTAKAAVNGLYSQMMRGNALLFTGSLSVFPGLSADEISNTATSNVYDQFYTNSLVPTENTQIYNGIWKNGYSYIYQANAIIEGIGNSQGMSEVIKRQLSGEVKFIRALCYFYLINLYGDVPLVTTTDYEGNAIKARSLIAEVYKQIITDLTAAKSVLQNSYPSGGKVRVNKLAAAALLARVYLYTKDWAGAESEASEVINSGVYNLGGNLSNVFKANSSETILEFMPVSTTINTYEGFIFIPTTSATAKPTFTLSSFLLNSFEANDIRKVNWVRSKAISGTNYYYPFKYTVRSGGAPYNEHIIMLRLAEQYLIRAEARAQQNNLSGGQSDLNVVRNRAGLPNTNANSQSTLIMAIEQERKIELFCELGHRWFDLKRTSRSDAVFGINKAPNWQSTDELYPIPQNEIDTNPFLTQNPGY